MLGAAAAARYITRQMALLLLAATHRSVLTLSTLFTPHIAHTTVTTTATELFSLGYSIIRLVGWWRVSGWDAVNICCHCGLLD